QGEAGEAGCESAVGAADGEDEVDVGAGGVRVIGVEGQAPHPVPDIDAAGDWDIGAESKRLPLFPRLLRPALLRRAPRNDGQKARLLSDQYAAISSEGDRPGDPQAGGKLLDGRRRR